VKKIPLITIGLFSLVNTASLAAGLYYDAWPLTLNGLVGLPINAVFAYGTIKLSRRRDATNSVLSAQDPRTEREVLPKSEPMEG
jgi:hypothetical protein